MPIYEFYCSDNHKLYSFWAPTPAYAGRLPRCPDDDALRMERAISGFSITGGDKEPGEDGQDPLFDEAAFGQFDRELGALDEAEASPRQLCAALKRFTELTGQRLPEAYREMLSRLEKSDDPDALEEQYANLLDIDALEQRDHLLKGLREPQRDLQLYDLRDYL